MYTPLLSYYTVEITFFLKTEVNDRIVPFIAF